VQGSSGIEREAVGVSRIEVGGFAWGRLGVGWGSKSIFVNEINGRLGVLGVLGGLC
jgi:hypothetical protein